MRSLELKLRKSALEIDPAVQDAAERTVLIRVEGSRAVPAMLLAEATNRLNVGCRLQGWAVRRCSL